MKPDEAIPLSEWISHLREELHKALLAGKGKELRFDVMETEIELSVALTVKGEGKGGVNFWVYTAEASAGIDQLKTQKIRLKLKPVSQVGGNLLIADDNVPVPKS